MYQKNENKQVIQSKNMLASALLQLLEQNAFEDITITQICQYALVVRKTFYRNFNSKVDIIKYMIDSVFLSFTYNPQATDMYRELKKAFDHLKINADLLLRLEANHLFYLIKPAFSQYISMFLYVSISKDIAHHKELENYVLDFISSTICSTLELWVRNGFNETSETLAQICKVFLSGLQNNVAMKSET